MVLMSAPSSLVDAAPTPAAVLLLTKGGRIMLDDNEFFDDFELRFRRLAGSIGLYKMRPANNDLLVSFNDQMDFLATVRSASGVNIALEIGWLFEPTESERQEIGDCFLRLQLSNECVDERLSLFLDDLSLSSNPAL